MSGGPGYLVRHAAAEAEGPAGDAARRLTPEGRAEFQASLAALAGRLAVTRVVTSPFARARETATLLAAATGARLAEDARLASGASGGPALLALLAELGPGAALVGHNPEIAEAVALAAGRPEAVKPGTVAAIDPAGRLGWIRRP